MRHLTPRLSCLGIGTLLFLLPTAFLIADDEPQPRLVGRVLDEAGSPVGGVTIFGRLGYPGADRLFGRSRADGTFDLSLPGDADPEQVRMFVRADGYGLASASGRDHNPASPVGSEPTRIVLRRSVTITGRLVDGAGQPAEGVRVRPCRVWQFGGEQISLDRFEESAEWVREIDRRGRSLINIDPATDELLPWVETDDQGRFTIDSVGPECIAGLFVIGEHAQAMALLVRTDEGPPFDLLTSRDDPPVRIHPHGDVEAAVQPSVPIVGTVTRADTGSPVIGATITTWRAPEFNLDFANRLMSVQTDVFGRYKLIGMDLGNRRIFVEPPPGDKLLPLERSPELSAGQSELAVDWSLPTGVTIAGRVTDRNTNDPIPGRIEAVAFTDNPHADALKPARISGELYRAEVAEDGTFTMQVLPGPGILGFRAGGDHHDRYRRGVGWDQITHHRYREEGTHTMFRTTPRYLNAWDHHQIVAIDPPAGPGVHQVNIVVGEPRIDVPLEITRTPGGPTQVYYSNETADRGPGTLLTFDFSTQKLEPGTVRFFPGEKSRVVQAYDRDRKLAGFTYVHSTDTSARIDLRKAATLRGRVLQTDGSPLVGADMQIPYDYDPSTLQAIVPSQPAGGYYPETDEDGRFELVGLCPDLPLTVEIKVMNAAGNRILDHRILFENLSLNAGQEKDLGEIKFDSLKLWQRPE